VNRIRPPRYLAILALLPAFALVFWMTALLASNLASLLIVGVNVHGLSLASYAGDAGPRPCHFESSRMPGKMPEAQRPHRVC
jgi:hypothetical protein